MTKSINKQNTEEQIVITLEKDTVQTLDNWCRQHQDFDRKEAIRHMLGLCLVQY